MKLGSLFDGSGGFPLAGTKNGITPVWASEIEPYPIAVTTARFPLMKHLGSITEINGRDIEPVDIITFGSPCQDLSIAGNQKGIVNGARSSLFFQAIRIIKEMRDATNGVYPNYAVWENVPGAFSSNKGNDFRLVLEALASISEPTVSIPMPEKWQRSGEIVGDGYSIAWRTLDAQFWGVPQRRKRIYLVADFASERAGQILFEREGVRGDTAQSREAGEGTAEDSERSVGGSVDAGCLTPWDVQSRRVFDSNGKWPAIYGGEGGGHGYALIENTLAFQLCGDRDNASVSASEKAYCIPANPMSDRGQAVCYALDALSSNSMKSKNPHSGFHKEEYAKCLDTSDQSPNKNQGGNVIVQLVPGVAYSVDCRNMCLNEELSGTMQAKENGGQSLNYQAPVVYSRQRSDELVENAVVSCQSVRQYKDNTDLVVARAKPPRKYIVRRLTPTECARLQGFPDHWGDVMVKGKPHSDSAEYRLWGNGIALPCAEFVLRRISQHANQR